MIALAETHGTDEQNPSHHRFGRNAVPVLRQTIGDDVDSTLVGSKSNHAVTYEARRRQNPVSQTPHRLVTANPVFDLLFGILCLDTREPQTLLSEDAAHVRRDDLFID